MLWQNQTYGIWSRDSEYRGQRQGMEVGDGVRTLGLNPISNLHSQAPLSNTVHANIMGAAPLFTPTLLSLLASKTPSTLSLSNLALMLMFLLMLMLLHASMFLPTLPCFYMPHHTQDYPFSMPMPQLACDAFSFKGLHHIGC